MHRVGGHPLCGMHSRGVTQLGGGGDIAGGERDGAAVPYVPHLHTTSTGQVEDGPPVTVFTQSVAVTRSLRSFLRVMIRSPTLARLPSANLISWFGVVSARRWFRARWLSRRTSSLVGASMIASRPRLRSACQPLKTASRVVVGSPTWMRRRSR